MSNDNGPFGALVLRQTVNVSPTKAGEMTEEFLGEIREGYSETSEVIVVRFDNAPEITIAPMACLSQWTRPEVSKGPARAGLFCCLFSG